MTTRVRTDTIPHLASDLARPARDRCECRCGYRCGGPGVCSLSLWDCLGTDDGKHFVRECGHKWDGPPWTSDDGLMTSVTCSKCGTTAMHHDARVGP